VEEVRPEQAVRTPRDIFDRVLAVIRRAKQFWPAIAVAAVIAIPVFVVTPKLIPPVYLSETVVLYREIIQTENLLGSQQYMMENRRNVGIRLREMLLSRSNLEKIIETYKLYPDIVASDGKVDAVEKFAQKIDVRVREGETFRIQYQGDEAEVVFKVTEALAKSLVEQNRTYRVEQAESTKQFLEVEQQRTSAELNQKQGTLAEFLARHPEFAQDIVAGGQTTAGASVRAAARTGAGVAAAAESGVEALERQARRLRQQLATPGAMPSPEVPTGPMYDPTTAAAIAEAEQELIAATRTLSEKQSTYTAQHPDVVAAQARVSAAQARVAQVKAKAKPVAPAAAAAPPPANEEERREQITGQLNRVEAALARAKRADKGPTDEESSAESERIVDLETEWASLNRELNEVRARYEQIQARFFRASIVASVEASGQASQMVIVDPAYLPQRPTKRGAKRTGLVGALVTVLLGVAVAFGLGALDNRLYNEQDIRRLKLGPIVHVIPKTPRPRKVRAHG
jgi:uncharacterized protein involved in exopolysaccharide biosynthesis